MATTYWFDVGITGGVVLFLILERIGIIEEWLDDWYR